MVDFSKYKAMQGADEAGFTPHYLVLENGAQLRDQAFRFLLARHDCPSISALPKIVRTVSISGCSSDHPGAPALEQLDLRNLEGVQVLHLVDNPGVQEVLLSLTTAAHLRSITVRVPVGCSSLRFTVDADWCTPLTASDQVTTGGKLAWLELEGNIVLSTCRKPKPWWSLPRLRSTASPVCGLGILQPLFSNLEYLALSSFPATSIDLTTCTILKRLRLKNMPGLRDIHGLETLTNLEKLTIRHCDGLVLLSIPVSLGLISEVDSCRSLERISLPAMPHQEVDPSACASYGWRFYVTFCPALRKVDGIVQFARWWSSSNDTEGIQEAIQNLLKPFETGSSKFKAKVQKLVINKRSREQGLAGLQILIVRDAQHVGLLISALAKAQAKVRSPRLITDLSLSLSCEKDGDCGCDRNEFQYFGPCYSFHYCCHQVRNLASLHLLGDELRHLSLRGCKNVEMWPDFAAMTSLVQLDLSYTSLEKFPTGVLQLLHLELLAIKGCWKLPAKEMIKAITCRFLSCNYVCGSGLMNGLLADLKAHRRDKGSVADALNSRWPELVAIFYEQWQYLQLPCPYPVFYSSYPSTRLRDLTPGRELCYLIRLMYELWFADEAKLLWFADGESESEAESCACCTAESESEAESCACADSISKVKEKMKRLLCTEIFMALPFYVWRIGRSAVDKWEEYPWPEGYESYMVFALIGSASIGCFNASPNEELKDRMVNFIQSFDKAQPQRAGEDFAVPQLSHVEYFVCSRHFYVRTQVVRALRLTKKAHERLAMRVGDAVCKMARSPSVAAALGQDFMPISTDGLKTIYTMEELPSEARESLLRWLIWISYQSGYSDSEDRRRSELEIKFGLMWGWKPSVTALKSGQASVHNTMDDDDDDDGVGDDDEEEKVRVLDDDDGVGVRVLHKVMHKILPVSVLFLRSIWSTLN